MDKNNLFSNFDSFFNDFESYLNFPFNGFSENKTETGKDSNGEWLKQTFTSKDGSYKVTTFMRTSGKIPVTKQDLTTKIGDLKSQLEVCVEKQEFEMAAKLRDKIKSLQDVSDKKIALNKELESAIKEQNFERAIEIRDELKKLK